MKIAVVGGGFTGLSASLTLSQLHHDITLFEKEKTLGGLASGIKLPGWQWMVEQHYHHWFTNDSAAIGLINKLGLRNKFIIPETLTSIFYDGKTYPFNLPNHILSFSPLPIIDRLRTGVISLFLKLAPEKKAVSLEKYTAKEWLIRYYGKKTYEIVWKPLLIGKFGNLANTVNMAWFWARIKKRTLKLGYIEGGYQTLIDALASAIIEFKGKIYLNFPFDPNSSSSFDKIIITAPSPIFIKMYPQLPNKYKQNLTSIPHLHALNLLLITREKFLPHIYWLNINDRSFPFLAVIQQTNMISPKYYGNQHLTWIANYLPPNHPYLKITKEKLLNLYLPYLAKINPHFNHQSSIINYQLFFGPFAQPVFPRNYSKLKPDFATPIPNVYLANMDMVYPWDRGTNYAIEMGEKVANLVHKSII